MDHYEGALTSGGPAFGGALGASETPNSMSEDSEEGQNTQQ